MQSDFFNYNVAGEVDSSSPNFKVADTERYIADYKLLAGLSYGVFINSSIEKGIIKSIDSREAESMDGVLSVLSHLNRPDLPGWKIPAESGTGLQERSLLTFYDARIHYYRQPVVLIVATSYDKAVEAARLVNIAYIKDTVYSSVVPSRTRPARPERVENYSRGETDKFSSAFVKVETEYTTSFQATDPAGMHATLVAWDPHYKLGDPTRSPAVKMAQREIMKAFTLKEENVSVYSSALGAGINLPAGFLPHETAALLAAKKMGRPVTVIAGHGQVWNTTDHRAASIQKIELGASPDGVINGITHEALINTYFPEETRLSTTDTTRSLYACKNIQTINRQASLLPVISSKLRSLQETTGSFALESAMDELSYTLMIDPMLLRLKNFAEKDPENGLPWSSNYLKECYSLAAESFGWSRRNRMPGAMRAGDWMFGMGMSTGSYSGSEIIPAAESAAFKNRDNYSIKSFCAHFVEVAVHCTTGKIKVIRIITAVDAGKIPDMQAAAGQVYSSIIRGIGMSLKKEGADSHLYENYANDHSAGTGIPLNDLVPPIEVIFINKPDPVSGPMGSKNVGDIGLMGFSAAIANAVYHATGMRVRSLPIQLDKRA